MNKNIRIPYIIGVFLIIEGTIHSFEAFFFFFCEVVSVDQVVCFQFDYVTLLSNQWTRIYDWCTIFLPIPAHAPITAHQRHFQFKICGTINRPLKSSHPVASATCRARYWIPKTTNWCYVNFHLLTFRPISFFYQLFKLANFEPCHNQKSLRLGHISPIC